MDEVPCPMPSPTGHADLLLDVLADHAITPAHLARGTGLSPGYVSRVLSGQFAPPPCVLQYLWRRTADPRVALVALGDDTVAVRIASPGLRAARPADAIACAAVAAQRAVNGEPLRDRAAVLRDLDALIVHAATARLRIAESPSEFPLAPPSPPSPSGGTGVPPVPNVGATPRRRPPTPLDRTA
ncbi:MAG: hypothetical protein BroJett004_08140 [Planctomycetota bacterium]|nr:MAG: hypothetical protein BroJett004_08140 [Planctomycetota bacterium]